MGKKYIMRGTLWVRSSIYLIYSPKYPLHTLYNFTD